MSTVHVIGAGVAGLAAACALAARGQRVIVHESAKFAGGRARSYLDPALGARIDNGNHLLLSGNDAAMEYLARIGQRDALAGPATPAFPFIDLRTGARWTLRLSAGRIPFWLLRARDRVPGTRLADYAALLRLRAAGAGDIVADKARANKAGADKAGGGALYRNLLEPLAIAALNTMPDVASAGPLAAVIRETLARGGAASLPRFPRIGLSESFVDPALAWLARRGAEVRFGDRIGAIGFEGGRAASLNGVALGAGESVVLAAPPWVAADLIAGLTAPDAFESIANLHFRARIGPGEAGFWGLIGGIAEWAFAKGDILSVTVSAANRHAAMEPAALAAAVWADLSRAFALPAEMPAHRVVWEKRATFAATPAQLARRPQARTRWPNLVLAGDWTDTGLPATIEGAIRSGNTAAAALALARPEPM